MNSVTSGDEEISGIVVDLEGKPIENAMVEVMQSKYGDPYRWQGHRENSQFETDSEGRFALRHVPPGTHQLWLRSARGNPANSTLIKTNAGERDLRLMIDRELPPELDTLQVKKVVDLPLPALAETQRLENAPTKSDVESTDDGDSVFVRGRLVGADGQPIVGASLTCVTITNKDRRMYRSYPPVTSKTETDREGYFTVQVADETLQITWQCSAAGFAAQNIVMPVDESATFEAKLDREAAIEGRLLRAGKPLANVKIGLVEEDRSYPKTPIPRELTTDEEGVFRFVNLSADEKYVIYTLIGEETDGALPESRVTAPGSGALALLGDIETQTTQTITVSVQTLDGQPFPKEAFVSFSRRKAYQGSRVFLENTVQGEATVSLSGVGHEIVGVSVYAPGYETIRSLPNLIPDMNRRYQLNTSRMNRISLFLQPKPE